MARLLLAVLATATVGSVLATILASVLIGGTGAPSPQNFILDISLASMIFTVPGVIMLIGMQAKL